MKHLSPLFVWDELQIHRQISRQCSLVTVQDIRRFARNPVDAQRAANAAEAIPIPLPLPLSASKIRVVSVFSPRIQKIRGAYSMVTGRTPPTFDLPGYLELVDRPAEATSVEAMMVSLHPLVLDYDVEARPDRDGKFVLKNVKPGRYSLTLPFPGRIRTFAIGSKELAPDGFRLDSSGAGPLQIVVSLKTSIVSVKVREFPSQRGDIVAMLAPADPYLTLRESCSFNTLAEPRTTFRWVPPGEYRIFIVDSQFQSDVVAYAPRFADFLKDQATPVEVREEGETEATARYVDGETVKLALRQGGSIH